MRIQNSRHAVFPSTIASKRARKVLCAVGDTHTRYSKCSSLLKVSALVKQTNTERNVPLPRPSSIFRLRNQLCDPRRATTSFPCSICTRIRRIARQRSSRMTLRPGVSCESPHSHYLRIIISRNFVCVCVCG